MIVEPTISFDERNIQFFSNENYKTCPTLTATDYKGAKGVLTPTHCVDTFPTLLSSTAGVSRPGNAVTEHQTYIAYNIRECAANNTFNATQTDTATTLQKTQLSVQSHHTQTFVTSMAFTTEQTPKFNKEQALTLTKSEAKHNQCVITSKFVDTYNGTIQGDVAATMTADMAGPTHSGPKVMQNMAVRRLTPVECERLQGFPDNYTNIKENCPDGNRYRALGNSMAVPVMRWIGERINQYERP
jgi:site-specific DNA-cytosine methylase